jgi:hypothetical protein
MRKSKIDLHFSSHNNMQYLTRQSPTQQKVLKDKMERHNMNKGRILPQYGAWENGFIQVKRDVSPDEYGRCIKYNGNKFAELYLKFKKKRQTLNFVCWYIKCDVSTDRHNDYIHHCNIIDMSFEGGKIIDVSGGQIQMIDFEVWKENTNIISYYDFNLDFLQELLDVHLWELLNCDGFNIPFNMLVRNFGNFAFKEFHKTKDYLQGKKNIMKEMKKLLPTP